MFMTPGIKQNIVYCRGPGRKSALTMGFSEANMYKINGKSYTESNCSIYDKQGLISLYMKSC